MAEEARRGSVMAAARETLQAWPPVGVCCRCVCNQIIATMGVVAFPLTARHLHPPSLVGALLCIMVPLCPALSHHRRHSPQLASQARVRCCFTQTLSANGRSCNRYQLADSLHHDT